MEYITKGFRFDEEVMAWLDKLKAMHGSYNKGLRLIAFTEESRGKPPIDVEAHSVAVSQVCGQPTVDEAEMSKPAAEVLDKAKARLRPTVTTFRSNLRREAREINARNRVPGDPHWKGPLLKPKDQKK